MKTLAGFTLLAVWLSAVQAAAQVKTEYFALDGELVLSPQLPGPITSITWKNKGNIVADWVKELVPLEYFGDFKTNTDLNVTTGELIISNMKKVHAGIYTLEVNNNNHPVEYNTVEIKKVPKPQVKVISGVCNQEMSECTLSCDGDVTEAEPVTCLWKKGDGEWTESGKDMNIINDEETQGVETFSCKLKNPVSEEDSKEFPNPFFRKGCWITILVSVMRCLCVLFFLCVVFGLMWKKRSSLCQCECRKGDDIELKSP